MKVGTIRIMQVCGNNIKRYPNIWQYNRYYYKGLPMQQTIKKYIFLAIFSLQVPVEAMQLAALKTRFAQSAPVPATQDFYSKYSKEVARSLHCVNVNKKGVIITSVAAACALSLLSPRVRRCIDYTIMIPLQARVLNLRYGKPQGNALVQEVFQALYKKQPRKIFLLESRVGAQEITNVFSANFHAELLEASENDNLYKLKQLLKLKKARSLEIEKTVGGELWSRVMSIKKIDAGKLIKKYAPEIIQNANINQDEANRAFYAAVQNGDLVEAQLNHIAGANIDLLGCKRKTALMDRVIAQDLFFVQELLKMGASVNGVELGGKTALMYAVKIEDKQVACDMIDLLLAQPGINPNMQDKSNNTALTLAINANSERAVAKLLASKKIDLALKSINDQVPLFDAASPGRTLIAGQLLESAPELVNEPNGYNRTPLHNAALNGSANIVRLLLEHGADVTLKDSAKETAEDIARAQKYEAVVVVFEEFKKKHASTAE